MPKITREQFYEAAEAQRKSQNLVGEIKNRCCEIAKSICKIYGKEYSWCYFGHREADEISGGEFDFSWTDFVDMTICTKPCGQMICDLEEAEGFDFSYFGFPIRFLYEDFEKEVEEGRAKAKARIKEERISKNEKARAEKIRNKEIAAAAKEKLKNILTPEERKALRIRS